MKKNRFSSLCIAAPSSGAGKTTVTLGILRLLSRRGWKVRPFKCGPDYIDPEYHKQACGVNSINLDAWMMGEKGVTYSYSNNINGYNFAVIEGVMGVFDGAFPDKIDGSTAQIAKLLSVPVILVIDARSMARSAAALVKGFCDFDNTIKIKGVIANNVSSDSHSNIISKALNSEGLPPLIGALPPNESVRLDERHLGLFPETETKPDNDWYERLADFVENYIDAGKLIELSESNRMKVNLNIDVLKEGKILLGVAYDKAFHFYYEDNLELLRKAGFELVFFSPLSDSSIPENVEALYLGGGFPEVFAAELAGNAPMKNSIRNFFDTSAVIYAECGGLMYLCESLTGTDNCGYEMCGVIPAKAVMEKKLARLGYIESRTLSDSFFGPPGTVYRGHEFHWSSLPDQTVQDNFCEIRKAGAEKPAISGFKIKNLIATYVHAHFFSNPHVVNSWAEFIRKKTEV